MAFTRALYYPTIDIHNVSWLKTAILYWDEINTIVPSSIDNPYNTPSTRYLSDEGVLRPLSVHSNMDLIEDLTNDILNYYSSNEVFQLFNNSKIDFIHTQKLPYFFRHKFDFIHSDKLAWSILNTLRRNYDFNEEWIPVSEDFARFYMTLLANQLCERYRIAPLTDDSQVSGIFNLARFDNQKGKANYLELLQGERGNHYEHVNLAQGILIDLSFKGLSISDNVSFEDILFFKRQHQDELGRFRSNIEKLTNCVNEDETIEQIQQHINDIYINEFVPSYNDLKKSLSGNKINWIAKNFMKISFFSTGALAIPTALLDLPVPHALLAGATCSLISSYISYNIEKQNFLRHNPYSYLLEIDRTFRNN